MDALEQARAEIDTVDAQLAALFERRMAAVLQVAEYKRAHGLPIYAAAREAAVLEDFNAANDKLFESAWKSQFLSGLMMPIMNFVGNLGYVAVAIVGSIFAANGIITIGDIQAFIQ